MKLQYKFDSCGLAPASSGTFWEIWVIPVIMTMHNCTYTTVLIYSDLMTRVFSSVWEMSLLKKIVLSCQCKHININKEVNNKVDYLFQVWDGAVFFSGHSRMFSILVWADSLLIGWKWPPECQCVCSSLSCIDKLIIIYTLNGDLSVLPHLYYSLIVDDTTSAHLVENKTYNHDYNSSPQQPRQYVFCEAYQIGEQTHYTNVNLILVHE